MLGVLAVDFDYIETGQRRVPRRLLLKLCALPRVRRPLQNEISFLTMQEEVMWSKSRLKDIRTVNKCECLPRTLLLLVLDISVAHMPEHILTFYILLICRFVYTKNHLKNVRPLIKKIWGIKLKEI